MMQGFKRYLTSSLGVTKIHLNILTKPIGLKYSTMVNDLMNEANDKRTRRSVSPVQHASVTSKKPYRMLSTYCKLGCTNVDGSPRECEHMLANLKTPVSKEQDIGITTSQEPTLFDKDELEEYTHFSQLSQRPASPRLDANDTDLHEVLQSLRGKVIEIEGNIGCGKSTLSAHLQKLINLESMDGSELAVLYGEKVNHAFLKSFYDEPKRQAFAFQMYMLTTRLAQMADAFRESREHGKTSLLDRGAVGDVLFALNNHQAGNISDSDLQIYRSVCCERFPISLSDNVDLLLYLDVSPEECWRRMVDVRQREAERNVPPDYLYTVDYVYHELLIEWLGERDGKYFCMNVGKAPPLRVVTWEHFGCTKNAAKILHSLTTGVVKNPVIRFLHAKDTNKQYDIVIDTPEEAKVLWDAIDAVRFNETSTMFEYKGNKYDAKKPMAVAMNYEMDRRTHHHIRRLGYHFMSVLGSIDYYGPTAIVPKSQRDIMIDDMKNDQKENTNINNKDVQDDDDDDDDILNR